MRRPFNYFEHFLNFAFAVSGCVSVVGVPIDIASSAVELKTCITNAGIKKSKSIIKKKKENHDKTVLLAKTKLNTIKVLISESLIDSYISHDKFVPVNNVLQEYNEMKKEIKNLNNTVEYTKYKQWKPIASVVKKILKTKTLVLEKRNKRD